MKVAVFFPTRLPYSVRSYTNHVVNGLEGLGIDIVCFSEKDSLPETADLFWDPRCAGGSAPYRPFQFISKPLVVTVHGAAPMALPAREYFRNLSGAIRGKIRNIKNLHRWRAFRGRCTAIITVSEFAKDEIASCLEIERDIITPIYHGVELTTFRTPARVAVENEKYFLHVSQYQPIKNIARIFEAYSRLGKIQRPRLLAIVPGYPSQPIVQGIELIREQIGHSDLAEIYQRALGLIFPSLRESFGMPILEAMASGCPVITSNNSACKEVAADAAILVNPRSVEEIRQAMRRLIADHDLRETLRKKGLERSREFTWERAAEEHLNVFHTALNKV